MGICPSWCRAFREGQCSVVQEKRLEAESLASLASISLKISRQNGLYCSSDPVLHCWWTGCVGGLRAVLSVFKHFSVLCSFAAVISAHPIHSLDNPHHHFHSGSLASPTCNYLHHQANPWPVGPPVSHSDRANSTGEKSDLGRGVWKEAVERKRVRGENLQGRHSLVLLFLLGVGGRLYVCVFLELLNCAYKETSASTFHRTCFLCTCI